MRYSIKAKTVTGQLHIAQYQGKKLNGYSYHWAFFMLQFNSKLKGLKYG